MTTPRTERPEVPIEQLPAELRRRAKLRMTLRHSESEKRDAYTMEQAAEVIENLRHEVNRLKGQADTVQTITIDASELAIARLLENAGIPIVAEIHPRPDPELGHVFEWPTQEIEQLCGGK